MFSVKVIDGTQLISVWLMVRLKAKLKLSLSQIRSLQSRAVFVTVLVLLLIQIQVHHVQTIMIKTSSANSILVGIRTDAVFRDVISPIQRTNTLRVIVFGKMQTPKVETRSIHEMSINKLPQTLFRPAVSEACVPTAASEVCSVIFDENSMYFPGKHYIDTEENLSASKTEHCLSSKVVPGRPSNEYATVSC